MSSRPQCSVPPDSLPTHPASDEQFSIRVSLDPDALCPICGSATGHGPVGYLGDRPICDLCLLRRCQPLGLVLSFVAVTRTFAAVDPWDRDDQQAALAQLGAFARIFERIASMWGPARSICPSDDVSG